MNTRFTHRARRSQLHPEDFYLDLAGLLGELMTFTEPSRLPCPLDVYDHHDLTKTFKTLLPGSQTGAAYRTVARVVNLPLHLRDGICRPMFMTRNCYSLPPLYWPWQQICLSIRSSVVYPAVDIFLAGKNPQYGQCADPGYSSARMDGGPPPASLPLPGSAISNSTRAARPGQKWLPPGPLHCMYPAVFRI